MALPMAGTFPSDTSATLFAVRAGRSFTVSLTGTWCGHERQPTLAS